MPNRFSDDEPSRRLGFSGGRLDRLAEKRGDSAWLAAQAARRDARAYLFLGERALVRFAETGAGVAHGLDLVGALGVATSDLALLGFADGAPRLAGLIAALPEEAAALGLKAIDLRSLALQNLLPAEELGALAQARSLLHWHATHKFCSGCGAPTRMAAAGYRQECAACGAEHFPRTDPVVIMLAIRGEECLLGRQPRFPPGMFSCLAGFVEPGETIEAAVRRETREEAGIEVGRVAYVASQPWPFPASLMIGVFAEAITAELRIDTAELEAARWFSRPEILAMLSGKHPDGLFAPPPIAIARELLRLWAEEE